MIRTLIASLIVVFGALSAAKAEVVPKAAPSVLVDRLPLAEAIPTYPDDEWARRPLMPPINVDRFRTVADRAFADPQPDELTETRALVVIQDGVLVYERYAKGYGPNTRFISWSMAKSVTQALIGIGVRDGHVSIDAPLTVTGWASDDARHEITLRHLLANTSGLKWKGLIGNNPTETDDAQLLYGSGRTDVLSFLAGKPLDTEPGTVWKYNTGGFHLAMAELTHALTPAGATPHERRTAMQSFMETGLFAPLGITSAVPEFDPKGRFLGGSNIFMTATDYARFGLLYLREGMWNGEQVLPEGWTELAATQTTAQNTPNYGNGFWLNQSFVEGGEISMPLVDPTAFNAGGNNNQFVVIVPDKKLVIVRLGHTPNENMSKVYHFIQDLVLAFPEKAGTL